MSFTLHARRQKRPLGSALTHFVAPRAREGRGVIGVLSLRLFGWHFIPWRGGADKSGAAKFLLDLLGLPDGDVAAAAIFFLANYGLRWRSGGGVMVPAPIVSVDHLRCLLARARVVALMMVPAAGAR